MIIKTRTRKKPLKAELLIPVGISLPQVMINEIDGIAKTEMRTFAAQCRILLMEALKERK